MHFLHRGLSCDNFLRPSLGFPSTANRFDIGVVINKLLTAKIKGEGVNAVKAF